MVVRVLVQVPKLNICLHIIYSYDTLQTQAVKQIICRVSACKPAYIAALMHRGLMKHYGNTRKTNPLRLKLIACINHFTTLVFLTNILKNIKIYNLPHEKISTHRTG